MILLDAAVSLLCAAISGMGVGGGSLLLLYLTLLRHHPQQVAQGETLLFFVCSALGSCLFLLLARQEKPLLTSRESPACKGGRPLTKRQFYLLLPIGLLGSALGAPLALRMRAEVLRRCFGGFLLLCGGWKLYASFRGKKKP